MKGIIVVLITLTFAVSAFCQTDNLREGDKCFNSGDYACAIAKYEEALNSMGGEDTRLLTIKLSQATSCSKWLKAADEAFRLKDYAVARENYKNLLEENPKDDHARTQLEKCEAALSQLQAARNNLREGDKCFEKGDYVCAIVKYEEALNSMGGEDTRLLTIKLSQATSCSKWLKAADEAFRLKDYAVAKENYQNVLNENPNDVYARNQLEECEDALKTTLSVSTRSLDFHASGGRESISIITNASTYTVNLVPSWCSVQKNGKSLVITCAENRNRSARTGYFMIAAAEKSVRINLRQPAPAEKTETILRISNQNPSFPASGGTSSRIKVHSNIGTYSILADPSWYSVKGYEGYFVVSSTSNNSTQPRSGSFKVVSGNKELTVNVSQSGGTRSSTTSKTNIRERKKKCFNCPNTRDTWGLTAGYIKDDSIEGVQLGLRIEPLFKYGFGLNTGLLVEGYSNDIISSISGDQGFHQYAINIPLHLQYRLNFSKWFNVFSYGGLGFNMLTNPSYDEYSWPTSFEYGGGIRVSHVQFNVGRRLHMGDMRDISNLGKDIKPYQDLILSISYMF